MLEQRVIDCLEQSLQTGMIKELGMQAKSWDLGKVRLSMPVQEKIANIYGLVHGGAIFALADTAAGFAARTYEMRVVTLSANMNFLTQSFETKELVCEAQVLRHGRKVIVAEAKVFDEKLTCMASGSYTFYVLEEET